MPVSIYTDIFKKNAKHIKGGAQNLKLRDYALNRPFEDLVTLLVRTVMIV